MPRSFLNSEPQTLHTVSPQVLSAEGFPIILFAVRSMKFSALSGVIMKTHPFNSQNTHQRSFLEGSTLHRDHLSSKKQFFSDRSRGFFLYTFRLAANVPCQGVHRWRGKQYFSTPTPFSVRYKTLLFSEAASEMSVAECSLPLDNFKKNLCRLKPKQRE